MNILKCFGENVKYYRIKRNMTQEVLADKCDLHRTYISDIERFNRNISLTNLQKIANALTVEPYILIKPQSEDNQNDSSSS